MFTASVAGWDRRRGGVGGGGGGVAGPHSQRGLRNGNGIGGGVGGTGLKRWQRR